MLMDVSDVDVQKEPLLDSNAMIEQKSVVPAGQMNLVLDY